MREFLRTYLAPGVLALLLVALAGCSPPGAQLPPPVGSAQAADVRLPEQTDEASPVLRVPPSPATGDATATPVELATATLLASPFAIQGPPKEPVTITVDRYKLYDSLPVVRFPGETWKPAEGYQFLFVDLILNNETPQEITVDVSVRGYYGNGELTSFPPGSFYDAPTMDGGGSVRRFVIRSEGSGGRQILAFEVLANADPASVKLSFDLTYSSATLSGHQQSEILLGTASATQ